MEGLSRNMPGFGLVQQKCTKAPSDEHVQGERPSPGKVVFLSESWTLEEARGRLREVVNRAESEGPQILTRQEEEAAVVLSVEDYRGLTAGQESLVGFLRNSPLVGLDLDMERRSWPDRRTRS